MRRSLILARRGQPLLSHLRRQCIGGDTVLLAAVAASPTGANSRRILPRPYASHANPQRDKDGGARPRRHLYLVLHELKTGFSMYKLNVDDLDGGDEDAVNNNINNNNAAAHRLQSQPCRRLPKPVLRLGYSTVGSNPHLEALGGSGKIVVTGVTGEESDRAIMGDGRRITLVYDANTAKLDIGQPLPDGFMFRHYHAAAAGNNNLYTVADSPSQWYCFCEVGGQPGKYYGEYDSGDELYGPGETEWVWEKRSLSPPAGDNGDGGMGEGDGNDDSDGDSRNGHVESYAVHPDGRTIFVSCTVPCACAGEKKPPFTFSMDTESTSRRRWRGDWSLPFRGRGYYDGDLDAWVGIREDNRGFYLCSCDVPDALFLGDITESSPPPPVWKTCNEKLTFLEDGAHSRTLIHTGRGRFCLVEVLPAPEATRRFSVLLHVTMFRAKHGKNGELLVAPCRPGRSYVVPSVSVSMPNAFWM